MPGRLSTPPSNRSSEKGAPPRRCRPGRMAFVPKGYESAMTEIALDSGSRQIDAIGDGYRSAQS